jgi:UDP-glucose 4-epimerase
VKALVTGGAGFIASHIVDRLLADGYEVTAMDNLTEGRLANLAHLKKEKRFRFVKADLRDARAVSKLVKGADAVFHLAAQANIRRSLVDHMADLENNLIGTINIMEGMMRWKVNDLVFASTSAIYGEATVRPTPEDYMPVQTSLYGSSKMACEAYMQAFSQFSDISSWSYRFSNVVGERCRRGVTWDFVKKLRRNPKELEILGDGKQSKEYIYVADCVEGIMTGYNRAKGRVNAFNLAVEENRTVDEVADIVVREMKLSGVKRRYTGGPRGWIGDNPVVHLDITRLKSLGWAPKVSADEAIARTARWAIAEQARS